MAINSMLYITFDIFKIKGYSRGVKGNAGNLQRFSPYKYIPLHGHATK